MLLDLHSLVYGEKTDKPHQKSVLFEVTILAHDFRGIFDAVLRISGLVPSHSGGAMCTVDLRDNLEQRFKGLDEHFGRGSIN